MSRLAINQWTSVPRCMVVRIAQTSPISMKSGPSWPHPLPLSIAAIAAPPNPSKQQLRTKNCPRAQLKRAPDHQHCRPNWLDRRPFEAREEARDIKWNNGQQQQLMWPLLESPSPGDSIPTIKRYKTNADALYLTMLVSSRVTELGSVILNTCSPLAMPLAARSIMHPTYRSETNLVRTQEIENGPNLAQDILQGLCHQKALFIIFCEHMGVLLSSVSG